MGLTKTLILTLVLAMLIACAHGPNASTPLPTSEQLVGVYSRGISSGAQDLELRSDGTYRQTLAPHWGLEGIELLGLWKLQGKYLFFYSSEGVYNAPDARFTYAEVFFHEGKPAFVRAEDNKTGLVSQWSVYTR